MTRADWQQIAEERLLAAQALLTNGNWPSAYYLAGYAVESGLKSCILANVKSRPEVIFEDKQFSIRCWSHDIKQLLALAGLTKAWEEAALKDAAFSQNWSIVSAWNEQSRYRMNDEPAAMALYNAVGGSSGVMEWIRARW